MNLQLLLLLCILHLPPLFCRCRIARCRENSASDCKLAHTQRHTHTHTRTETQTHIIAKYYLLMCASRISRYTFVCPCNEIASRYTSFNLPQRWLCGRLDFHDVSAVFVCVSVVVTVKNGSNADVCMALECMDKQHLHICTLHTSKWPERKE